MDDPSSSSHDFIPTSTSASIALRRTSIPNINIAVTRPHRDPLAPLDPQSSRPRLSDDSSHSSSSPHGYAQQPDAKEQQHDYNVDFSSYRMGRSLFSHPRNDGDFGEAVLSSKRSSLTQSIQPLSSNGRRASVPAIHFKTSPNFGIGSSTPTSNSPLSNPSYINNDELYSGLTTFTFGAALATRSSTPESDMLDPFPNRVADQRPRRSLSAVSTPRDDDIDDEADVARSSRAKMRAIDDGSRRPSLPKNEPSSSPRRHHLHRQSSIDSNAFKDMDIDRASTHAFGIPGVGHSKDLRSDKRTLASTPAVFAQEENLYVDDEVEAGFSYVLHVGNDKRRGSNPMNIPVHATWTNSEGNIRSGRKLSRSVDDDLHMNSTDVYGIDNTDPGTTAYSEPLTRGQWNNFGQQHQPPRAPDQENVYGGLDLAYILGSNATSGPRKSWSLGGSFTQYQSPSQHVPQRSFPLWFRSGDSEARRPSAATIGEDTFLKHIEVNDEYYKTRLKDWKFNREPTSGPRPSSTSSSTGKYDIWNCQVVGRFLVERVTIPQLESLKPPQQRLRVKPITDPYPHTRSPPSVIVHKHSRAAAFSIFRPLFKSHRNAKFNGRFDTNHSILLATRKVQEMYTSTKTTSRLETHGLLGHSPKDRHRDRVSQGSTETGSRSRSQSRSRKDRDKRESDNHKKMDKSRGKERNRETSQTTSWDSTQSNTQDKSKSEKTTWTRHLSGRYTTPPNQTPSVPSAVIAPSAPTSSGVTNTRSLEDPTGWNTSFSTTDAAGPSNSHHQSLHRSSSSPILDSQLNNSNYEDDDDGLDEYHLPPQRRSHAETYETLTPLNHEHIRRLFVSNMGTVSSRTRFRIFQSKKSGPSPDLPPNSSIAPSPVPWMLTRPSEKVVEGQIVMSNLNDNFGAVGLVPPRQPPRPPNRRRRSRDGNLLLQVPEDSLYMVIPLFAGETDPDFMPDSHVSIDIPLEERRYLLVYYVPFDMGKRSTSQKQTSEVPTTGSPSGQNRNKSVYLSSFRVSTHLMCHEDFKGTNVRLPTFGLSVTGALPKGTPPIVVPDVHMDAIAIAQCSKREGGIEFLPEGLHKLGLCHAEEVRSPWTGEDDEAEFRFELSPIGRAVVEMAWVGALAVTSFGSV